MHGGERTKMGPGAVEHLLRKYAARIHERDPLFPAGLHAHMLRHSIATAMYRAGTPVSYIRDFPGHVSVDTTMVYAHAGEDAVARAVEAAADAGTGGEGKRWKGREEYLLEFCGLA